MLRASLAVFVVSILLAGCASPPASTSPTPAASASTTTPATSTEPATATPSATPTPPTATPTPTLPPCASATATGCAPATPTTPTGAAHLYAGPYSANGPGGSPTDCAGVGPVPFARAPMNDTDFAKVLPYGIVVGGHVTPIDHMYLAPLPGAKGDAAPVFAIAEGNVTDIQTRPGIPGVSSLQYRVWIVHSCTFYSYFDLATSLSPFLSDGWTATVRPDGSRAPLHVHVMPGDYLARVGGETLDLGVYDDQSVLPGLLVPEHYAREPWKIHTVDPLPYFPADVRATLLAKDTRHAEPRAGKIDDDIDGTLAGTWFVVGTNGYAGVNGSNAYWSTHASFIPDTFLPDHLIVSLGNWSGQARQFGVQGNAPAFANVTPGSGPVAFTLVEWSYANLTTGASFGRDPPAGVAYTWKDDESPHFGVVLAQLTGARTLRLEVFPNATAGSTPSFDAGALTYER